MSVGAVAVGGWLDGVGPSVEVRLRPGHHAALAGAVQPGIGRRRGAVVRQEAVAARMKLFMKWIRLELIH